jgi:single-stranded DNA-binding protein
MLNQWMGIGNVVNDPELQHGNSATYTQFRLACDRGFESSDGQVADFIPIGALCSSISAV